MIITPNKFGLLVFQGQSDGSSLTLVNDPSIYFGRQMTIKRIYNQLRDANGNVYSIGYPVPAALNTFTDINDSYFNLKVNGQSVFKDDSPVLINHENLFLTVPQKTETIETNCKVLTGGSAFDVWVFIECYFDLFTNDKTV